MVCLAGLKRRTQEWKFSEYIYSVGDSAIYKVFEVLSSKVQYVQNPMDGRLHESKSPISSLCQVTNTLLELRWAVLGTGKDALESFSK